MDEQKSLRAYFSQKLSQHQRRIQWFLPNGGTILIVLVLLLTQKVWGQGAFEVAQLPGPSATTVNFQGQLSDSNANPVNGNQTITFAIYASAANNDLVWGPETHVNVPVSNGLFSVGLGSQTVGGIPTTTWDGDRYLQITINGEALTPRELIRSVPIAGLALTVPDGAITADKLSPTAAGRWSMYTNPISAVHQNGGSDFTWQVADLSSTLPATADIALVKVYLKDTLGNGQCRLRPLGSTHAGGTIIIRTWAANIYAEDTALIALTNNKFEYLCDLEPGATIGEMGVELWGYYESGY
jgi:hypothetical protein